MFNLIIYLIYQYSFYHRVIYLYLLFCFYRGADDLLPLLSYVVIRSEFPQIVSECHLLETFIHER